MARAAGYTKSKTLPNQLSISALWEKKGKGACHKWLQSAPIRPPCGINVDSLIEVLGWGCAASSQTGKVERNGVTCSHDGLAASLVTWLLVLHLEGSYCRR